MNKTVNLFVDMDGVIAQQRKDIEFYMHDEYFFLNLPPVLSMIKMIKKMSKNNYEIFILSTIINNNYCEIEKNLWLDKNLPQIKKQNRFFVPQGIKKSDFIKKHLNIENSINVLIDDFTENLIHWNISGALPIKANDDIDENIEKIEKLIKIKSNKTSDK